MLPTSHIIKGNYPTFELPNDILQWIEESLDDLRLMHNDDVFVGCVCLLGLEFIVSLFER
jgi:hypothetical protein